MTTRPDIIVVLSDQQRPDSCGVFGQSLEVTPVLDALAADGVAFDEAFTVAPLCGPARSVIQTGLMPTSTGCWRNGRSLPPGVETLAGRLGALGYWTGYVGKWHLASDGNYSGYDVPADLAGRLGDWRWNYAEYLACCASLDANLGRLTGALQASGELDGTVLVYTSDHGSHFRTRNLEYKRTAHDASIRVPLVVRGPGFRRGRRSSSLVSNLDVVPTLESGRW